MTFGEFWTFDDLKKEESKDSEQNLQHNCAKGTQMKQKFAH